MPSDDIPNAHCGFADAVSNARRDGPPEGAESPHADPLIRVRLGDLPFTAGWDSLLVCYLHHVRL